MSNNIKTLQFSNNNKVVSSVNAQPNSVIQEIVEKVNQLSEGLTTVSDLVFACKDYGFIVQSFANGVIRLSSIKDNKYVSSFGVALSISEDLVVRFTKENVITDFNVTTYISDL